MFANLSGWHLIVVIAVILLLFGATRLPALAKSIGQSAKIFRKEIKDVAGPESTTAEPSTSEP
jgi:sec-independent protein translocase protein TatA